MNAPIIRATGLTPSPNGHTDAPRAVSDEWADQAFKLADWAQRLVNRRDVWGGYYLKGTKVERTTRPTKKCRGRHTLCVNKLAWHFRATKPEQVIGLHSTSFPDNTSRWGAVDIDQHADDAADVEMVKRANLDAATGWYADLIDLGFRPLLVDSNGTGGYHLWAIFSEPQPTPDVYDFLRRLITDFRDYGLSGPPETFPKQPRLVQRPGKPVPCGNWLRLLGRHHTRDFWSRVWHGTAWLSGAPAVAHVLSLAGDPPGSVP